MLNPWLRLPATQPFVLPHDSGSITAFNMQATEQTKYDLSLLPEPFFGCTSAPVLLLALNPGWSSGDAKIHASPDFIEKARLSLAQKLEPYPFLHLQPGAQHPGALWWQKKTLQLVASAGFEAVARNLLCVQYFPYHSKEYRSSSIMVPSQQFGFALVRAAINRGAEVVVMRSLRRWSIAVPELASYPRVHIVRNPRNPCLSPNNLGLSFAVLVSRLKSGT